MECERQKITINALRHYVDRLKKIEKNEDEDIVLFTYKLKSDLNDERERAEEIIENIQKNGLEMSNTDGVQISIFKEDSMRNTLTNALLYYYNGLIESSKIVSKKLPRAPDLPLLKEEIELCKEFLNYLNVEHKLDTKIS